LNNYIEVDGRRIGPGSSAYIVAEMSANHNKDFEQAVKILEAAKEAGADAIKLQTYTSDTLTIDCDNEYFRIKGTLWESRSFYELYGEAYMPWEWQPKLKEVADSLGMALFSTPFDETAIAFLEQMNVPAHKVASFELVDLQLIRKVAQTNKPTIMSTGMASLEEIGEAVNAFCEAGGTQLALLKCTSAYPAPAEEMNLRAIPDMAERFGVPCGLSDHTLGIAASVAAVVLGACIIEKHFTLARTIPGPDSAFSLEPYEFKLMVEAVRTAEKALGRVSYEVTEREKASRVFRRSLFVVQDMKAGEAFTEENMRSIRPGYGLHTRYRDEIIGRLASQDIARGTPLNWAHVVSTR
jgi:N-acetylneuraminate synthase